MMSNEYDTAKRAEPRDRANWIGAPEFFNLNAACQMLNAAFGWGSTYLVGSSLHKRDHRDVDIRTILSDEHFDRLFPGSTENWMRDPTWSLVCSAIAGWLSARTGLRIDYQLQRQTQANEQYKGERCAVGLFYAIHAERDNVAAPAPVAKLAAARAEGEAAGYARGVEEAADALRKCALRHAADANAKQKDAPCSSHAHLEASEAMVRAEMVVRAFAGEGK